MRHRNLREKLSRPRAHRKALFRNMVTDLLDQEAIITTLAKAKASRRYADRMITLGKRGDLSARRLASKFLRSKQVLKKLFDTLGPRYLERPGGYTRVLKLQPRLGDAAKLALLELVDSEPEKKKKPIPPPTPKKKKKK